MLRGLLSKDELDVDSDISDEENIVSKQKYVTTLDTAKIVDKVSIILIFKYITCIWDF